ncbi:MAG: hypothetical protein Q7J31_15300 [Syntrophales bacterium]|nr:hypothetical protein [Syntrophales bacterium]
MDILEFVVVSSSINQAHLPQLDGVADFDVAFALHGEGVERLLESLDQCLGGSQFRSGLRFVHGL